MHTSLLTTPESKSTSAARFLWEMFVNPLDALTNLARENGDIAHVHTRRHEVFLLNHPDFIEQVLVKQQGNFVKGPALQRARLVLGEGLLTIEGDAHLEQRRALQPAFHRHTIESYSPTMAASAQRHISAWQSGQQMDMAEAMMRLTLDVALRSFFGHIPEGAGERVGASMRTLARLFPLSMLPLPAGAKKFFPAFRRASRDLNSITEALVANPNSGQAQKALIQLLRENPHVQFSDEQIRSHALTFMLAGHETTALLLAWAWDMLANHPEMQCTLQAEADRVLGDRMPTAEDISNLPFARSVVKETLRLRPPAWAMGRRAVKECEIGGAFLPAGSVVLISQWVMHHDPRYYASPEEFRPERWDYVSERSIPRFAFFPFGGGSRVCIGETFAWTEAIIVLALMARRWNVRSVSGQAARPKPGITLRPKNGVQVVVEKR
ncbi:MAG: Epi-isozizaene 5-monooxygenase/(E)-beta-farnesene synthase [Anaerolineales bacterium]|nr:Epi-isozizaene 5-monooxygenase/(E)-beta-farnesene synthase [Anaerolineales bacterium]